MDLEIIILSEVRKKRQIPYDITYMWNLKYNKMNLLMKQKQTRTENRPVVAKREEELGRDGLQSWD